MRGLSRGALVTCGLVGCAKAAPPAAEWGRPPPGPSAVQVTPRPTSVACTLDLDALVASIAHVPSPVVARAIIPSLDPRTMKAKVVDGDGGDPTQVGTSIVTDCHGGTVDAIWEDGALPTNVPAGTVKVTRKSLPDGREAVWLGTAQRLQACSAEHGFFAIVALDGPRVVVLGVSPWDPMGCDDPKGKLHAEKLGEETVYVAPDKFGSGAGYNGWEDVWVLRDGELRAAGHYDTLYDQGGTGEPDDAGLNTPECSATAHYTGDEIALQVETTWSKRTLGEAGTRWSVVKSASWVRRFGLRDGKLFEKPPATASPDDRPFLPCLHGEVTGRFHF